jgi:hypothetical protein
MPEWITCPACQLRHTKRPTGVCPRCKGALDGAGPEASAPAAASDPEHVMAAPSAAQALPGLGRLAQSARSEKLKSARGIMWFVGIMSILANGVLFALAAGQVDDAIEKELAKLPNRAFVDQAKIKEVKDQAVRTTHLITGGGVMLGMLFVGCALSVRQHPVPATVTALALYLGGNAIFAMLNPGGIASGIFIKVIIAAGLFKAVQAAIAYQKEQADVSSA